MGGRAILSATYRRWRDQAVATLHEQLAGVAIAGRVALGIELRASTRRRYDLDNRVKALQDALTLAGVLGDDSQVDQLSVRRGPLATADERQAFGDLGHALVTIDEVPA